MRLERIHIPAQIPNGKPPLLFVHGAFSGAWIWEPWMQTLSARGWDCHAFSFRGHGNSEVPPHPNRVRVRDYVEDLRTVLAEFKIPPILVGHSLGGLVIQRHLMERDAPAVVLVCPVGPKGTWYATFDFLRRHPLDFIKGLIHLDLYQSVNTPEKTHHRFYAGRESAEWVAAGHSLIEGESFAAYLGDMLFPRIHPRQNPQPPMLVVCGELDQSVAPRTVRFTAQFQQAELLMLPNQGHIPMMVADRDTIASQVNDWLSRQSVPIVNSIPPVSPPSP
ncbi:alpha/beta hydrolase [Pontibacter sp. G13]|uniref:alpha/beta hydrolase n=1 Tax=Pontibacter sp. G13 TaxID=3074898 RepID=UPI00288BB193|nr:alpha/beta hydrolase [Pontibacter sp. G13]WNJ20285.1 alpha/beta hydrolase [Pontibacter sp. G13]